MEAELLLLFGGVLFFAALVHGTVGLGFPMIATPLLSLVTDLQTAVIYTLVPTLLVNIMSIMSEGNFLTALKRFYPLALFAMLGSAIGTQVLISSDDPDVFKILLAVAILFYLILDFIKINIPWIRNCPTCSMRFFGLSAGVLSGLTNAMAPILIIYTLESKFTKSEMIQASNIYFLFGKITQIVLFSVVGVFGFEVINQSFLALFLVLLALTLGIKLKSYIKESLYKKVVKFILLIISIGLIIQTM